MFLVHIIPQILILSSTNICKTAKANCFGGSILWISSVFFPIYVSTVRKYQENEEKIYSFSSSVSSIKPMITD